MKRLLAALVFFFVAVLSAQSARAAEEPSAVIRATVDQAFVVLRDQELKKPEKRKERITRLRAIADRVFDWATMAQSSLGPTYRTITDDQRTEFVRLFKDLIADDYMDDLDRFMGDEKVIVQNAEVRDDQRVVKTILVTHSRERVPIDYFMHQQGEQWIVHDFSVEGVSLVNHYRKSFSSFLANHTFEQLLERLRARHAADSSS